LRKYSQINKNTRSFESTDLPLRLFLSCFWGLLLH